MNRKLLSDVVQAALTQLHGYVGGALPLDIIAVHESGGIVRVGKG